MLILKPDLAPWRLPGGQQPVKGFKHDLKAFIALASQLVQVLPQVRIVQDKAPKLGEGPHDGGGPQNLDNGVSYKSDPKRRI